MFRRTFLRNLALFVPGFIAGCTGAFVAFRQKPVPPTKSENTPAQVLEAQPAGVMIVDNGYPLQTGDRVGAETLAFSYSQNLSRNWNPLGFWEFGRPQAVQISLSYDLESWDGSRVQGNPEWSINTWTDLTSFQDRLDWLRRECKLSDGDRRALDTACTVAKSLSPLESQQQIGSWS